MSIYSLKGYLLWIFAGKDNDADEDEGHNNEDHDKDISKEKEKLDDDNHMSKSDTANGEITIPILRRNGPLLQSQWVFDSITDLGILVPSSLYLIWSGDISPLLTPFS